jgi:lysophospholipase L1-like esterase
MKIPQALKPSAVLILSAALALCHVPDLAAQGAGTVATQTNEATAVPHTNTAIVPRLARGFLPRHTNFVEIAKQGDIDILFMGDSITDWWRQGGTNGGKAVFEKNWGGMKVANFGIAGDTTQGVLWRLQNGEGQGYSPKAIMLMIGTNNLRNNSPPEIAEGVAAVVAEFRKDFPSAKILLLAIFPRADPGSNMGSITEINATIAKLHDGTHVFYQDINKGFLDADGNFLPGAFRGDKLHPAEKGYEIWADAVKEPLAKLSGIPAK